jgi:hypothetical protein
VSDFETKLRWLSERGNPVGAEELIERIEADLAGDPLVVVAKRREGTTMTKTQQSPTTSRPSRYRGPVWGVAAFVAVIAVAALYVAFAGDPDQVADTAPTPTTVAPDVESMTDLEVIEAGVVALYSGDAERAVKLFELGDIPDDQIRSEAAYQAAIGGRLTLNCTAQDTPGVFGCTTPYHNAMTDAIAYVDSPGDTSIVRVQDGVIVEFGLKPRGGLRIDAFPFHTFIMTSMEAFIHSKGQGLGECAILWEPTPKAECADLIMENLDEWAAWYGSNS